MVSVCVYDTHVSSSNKEYSQPSYTPKQSLSLSLSPSLSRSLPLFRPLPLCPSALYLITCASRYIFVCDFIEGNLQKKQNFVDLGAGLGLKKK
jgi:hypothetical protein